MRLPFASVDRQARKFMKRTTKLPAPAARAACPSLSHTGRNTTNSRYQAAIRKTIIASAATPGKRETIDQLRKETYAVTVRAGK